MANKVQLAYVAADGLFLLMGVFLLGFSIIVGNIRNEVPTEGQQAVRNLLYQPFPLTGGCLATPLENSVELLLTGTAAGIVNAAFVFLTFLVTLPGLATSSRKWLKLAGYMAVFCSVFTMILGLYVWVLTLTTRENFAPFFMAQSDDVKSLIQTSVSLAPTEPGPSRVIRLLTVRTSSHAAATSTARAQPS
jgi:hypothetical protein